MKLIGVTQRVNFISNIGETRDEIDHRLITFLLSCGYIPVQIPNSLDKHINNWIKETKIRAFLLSGGNNIGEYPVRDRTEVSIINFAYSNNLPLLGICRGMQIIGDWFGVKLHLVKNHNRIRHKIYGKIKKEVNSFHSYSLNECPKDFEILAKAEDGVIEAIRHQKSPIEAWMWHPEREKKFCKTDIKRIKCLYDSQI